MDFMRQQALLQEIENQVRPQIPARAVGLELSYHELGAFGRDHGHIVTDEVEQEHFLPSGTYSFAMSKLRDLMYSEGLGTWFIATFRFAPGAPMTVSYDYDSKPQLLEEPDRRTYEEEQQSFPRSEENMPDWFKQGLGLEA